MFYVCLCACDTWLFLSQGVVVLEVEMADIYQMAESICMQDGTLASNNWGRHMSLLWMFIRKVAVRFKWCKRCFQVSSCCCLWRMYFLAYFVLFSLNQSDNFEPCDLTSHCYITRCNYNLSQYEIRVGSSDWIVCSSGNVTQVSIFFFIPFQAQKNVYSNGGVF